jgi:hypothetical protein
MQFLDGRDARVGLSARLTGHHHDVLDDDVRQASLSVAVALLPRVFVGPPMVLEQIAKPASWVEP